MVALLGTLLLAFAPQTPAPPFSMELPPGYGAFEQTGPGDETWKARRGDALGQFLVQHLLVSTPGADVASVARDVRGMWERNLRGLEATVEAWQGPWGGFDGAGADIRYTRGESDNVALERVLLLGEHLVHAVWEGPAAQKEQALEALKSFRVPGAWIPVPPPETDPYSGLGPAGAERPFPGTLRIHVDLTGLPGQQQLVVEVVWDAPEGVDAGGWLLPPAATPVEREDGEGQGIRYRLRVDDMAGAGGPYGMARPPLGPGLAALDAAWLAVPNALFDDGPGYQAPAWSLRVSFPATLTVFSDGPGKSSFADQQSFLVADFAELQPGRAWPYFLAGSYKPQKAGARTWYLRLDAKAPTPDLAVRGVERLEAALAKWLPAARGSRSVVSFPGIGDRALPGLLVLDEAAGWFSEPLDATREGLSRRTWLARAVAAGSFGASLRGLGSAAPFLEASLAEYAAWRLLEAEWPEDAAALEAHWKAREAALGPLPMPLSMMPAEDAFGARRLQSRGALVWQAIERRAGRAQLDALLDRALAIGRPWSTQELQRALEESEESAESDWAVFFRDHVYGRLTPADTQ